MVPDGRARAGELRFAETDPRVRAALGSFLSASPGLAVVADAADAATALETARERAPDVALVDVLLPTAQDDLGLVRALTAELNIPAVAISIHGWGRASALAARAPRFLDQDSAPELLVVALHAAVRYPRQMS